MGSPLPPIAADIVLDELESKCIASLPFQLPFYFRYVDDITAVPFNKNEIIKHIFNSYNHTIQFTIEEDLEEKIVFLDILVIRDGDVIKTNWYQKSTCSGRYLNFRSHHPYNYKINVINNCKETCLMTCLLLYSPKIHRIFVNFSFFWHWVSLFLFPSIKIINATYDKKRKKREKTNVSATYGGPLQCHKFKDWFKIFVKDKNVEDS